MHPPRYVLNRRLTLALVLAAGALAAMTVLTGCTRELNAELTVYAEINAIRREAGQRPLVPDAALVEAARTRSADMAANGYFSHTPPDGCDYACLLDRNGVSRAYAGETIAWNTHDWSRTADAAVGAWGGSDPHLAKILDCHYVRFGSGVAQAADGRIYLTTIYEGAASC